MRCDSVRVESGSKIMLATLDLYFTPVSGKLLYQRGVWLE